MVLVKFPYMYYLTTNHRQHEYILGNEVVDPAEQEETLAMNKLSYPRFYKIIPMKMRASGQTDSKYEKVITMESFS